MLTKPKKRQGSNKPARFTILELLRHVKATSNYHTWPLFAVNLCVTIVSVGLCTSKMVNLAGLFDPCLCDFDSNMLNLNLLLSFFLRSLFHTIIFRNYFYHSIIRNDIKWSLTKSIEWLYIMEVPSTVILHIPDDGLGDHC